MIHIFKSTYLLPPRSELTGSGDVYLMMKGRQEKFICQTPAELNQKILSTSAPVRIQCGTDLFHRFLKSHWESILNDSSKENLASLIGLVDVDFQLKSKGSVWPMDWQTNSTSEVFPSVKPIDLSFEHISASYVLWPELVRPVMQKKLEYLCWEQIIQEISVIRSEVNMLIYNQKINRFLPQEFHIDHDENIEIQLYNNPLLSWLFDSEYCFSNVEYFKQSVNLEPVTHFYDSWMMSRSRDYDDKFDGSLDNLRWITEAITRGDWEELLQANLNRNFGCVYLDNTMIEKGNQVWASALLRDFAKNDLTTAKRLSLKPELFSTN